MVEYSLFGVPFKCTQDMFTKEKLRQTLCVYWADMWRQLVLLSLLLTPVFLISIFLIPIFVFIPIIVMVLYLATAAAIIYYTRYKKQYPSFEKSAITLEKTPEFKDWDFWKRYLLNAALGILTSWIFGPWILVLVADFFAKHIFLHGGTWGFVPMEKQPAVITN